MGLRKIDFVSYRGDEGMYQEYVEKIIENIKKTTLCNEKEILGTNYEEILNQLINVFTDTKQSGNQVFFIGNGGSAAIASHMTADFMKNGGMKTYSLYDNSVTTCMANDYGYEHIFSRPLEFLANKKDLLVAISSSGNSQNIINAIEIAKKGGCIVVTLTGFEPDNSIRKMGDYNLHVPICHYGMVESIHNLILQQIVDVILERDGMCL